MTSASPVKLRASPLFVPLVATLGLVFVALVTGGWIGEGLYALCAAALVAIAVRTFTTLESPSNWAAASALAGLAATAIFAATELRDIDADGGGGPALIPVAWLFAATSWAAHTARFRTLRWVITLVQTSFTTLSALVFLIVTGRSTSSVTLAVGYGLAGLIGALAAALAVTGIIARIRVEFAKRNR